MRKEAIVPRLRPEEFGLFAAALSGDTGFPQTFGAWLDRTAFWPYARAVDVGFQEFMSYCSNCGASPGMQVLELLASSKLQT